MSDSISNSAVFPIPTLPRRRFAAWAERWAIILGLISAAIELVRALRE